MGHIIETTDGSIHKKSLFLFVKTSGEQKVAKNGVVTKSVKCIAVKLIFTWGASAGAT